jgi:mono/diheme cytochrome c family protein
MVSKMKKMKQLFPLLAMPALATLCSYSTVARAETAEAGNVQISRGKYLVQFGSCTDCHTPGYRFGKPDSTRFLGGSDVGMRVSGLGTFVPPNLTPDKETGLGTWTKQQIMTAIQTGVTPSGRILAPVMPWHAYAGLTKSDAGAIVDYLKTLPPVKHQVPGPFGPDEKPPIYTMTLMPPDDTTQHN